MPFLTKLLKPWLFKTWSKMYYVIEYNDRKEN